MVLEANVDTDLPNKADCMTARGLHVWSLYTDVKVCLYGGGRGHNLLVDEKTDECVTYFVLSSLIQTGNLRSFLTVCVND